MYDGSGYVPLALAALSTPLVTMPGREGGKAKPLKAPKAGTAADAAPRPQQIVWGLGVP